MATSVSYVSLISEKNKAVSETLPSLASTHLFYHQEKVSLNKTQKVYYLIAHRWNIFWGETRIYT